VESGGGVRDFRMVHRVLEAGEALEEGELGTDGKGRWHWYALVDDAQNHSIAVLSDCRGEMIFEHLRLWYDAITECEVIERR
jgi:hypothetical protein